ncbi:glycosyltransferase involved in cell wall biosynthesis [Sinorhizobium kostiense]|uniref:Glycosyltransferase involved in cell wall biosynthesis n=1 Tax=Sinorhizobium kostiense TaxID=76747 RepID=A0ABS4QW74_9HYPH|nr:glycosyltransferase family 4 protein [Sinorhizobium kostiense]MBP2234901.1 glycosyltransferase involved in cell wall biosynthesis [Sinorhizobium kostiense]
MRNERPLRILHCFRSPVGGIFRHVRDLAEAHARAGHKVGILCDSTTGGAHEDALFDAVRPFLELGIIRVPIHRTVGPSDLGVLWRCYKEIRGLQPDVLHGHGAKGGALARIVGSALRVEKYRVARLYSPHGGSLHYDRKSLAGGIVFRLERLQEGLTEALVFVCDYERQTYFAKIGQPAGRSELIYNGVGDADFAPVETNPDAVDFAYIGMMRDLKGPDLFIDAFAETERAVGRPLSAVMIGDGPQRRQYEAMAARMGLSDRISLLPAMRTREAFALARTVVIPSRAESMPYLFLEALAAEKPVIATRVGGIPEVLGADSRALVEPDNAQALAATMAATIEDTGWAVRTMPDRERVRASFSASVMANRVMELYRELTHEPRAGEARLRLRWISGRIDLKS